MEITIVVDNDQMWPILYELAEKRGCGVPALVASFVGKQVGQICRPCAGMGFGHDGTNICTVCGGDGLNPRARGGSMPLKDFGMIGGPMSGPPPDFVICAPVPVPTSGVMTCRSGQDGRTFQGQKAPTCDGTLRPKAAGAALFFACDKCSLSHQVAEKDGVKVYGALL